MKIKNLKLKIITHFLFVICLFAYLFISARPVSAQTMENGLYRIQMGNFNSIAGESSGSDYNLSITSGELAPGLYTGENFTVKAGFQYVPRSTPFSFTISSTKIDFGLLAPTNPVTRTTKLTINNTDALGYGVTAAENHELIVSTTGAVIPDTTCDDGRCTESIASKWTNTLTYGFGYRCDRENATCAEGDSSFVQEDYFKQFANSGKDESATTIMSGGQGRGQEATILYKVNISSSQPAGTYSNIVTYLATPNY